MARWRTIVGLSLAVLSPGCATPTYHADGGGNGGSPGTGGTSTASGGTDARGGTTGRGGVLGSGGATGLGGAGGSGGATGLGGAIVTTGGNGGNGADGGTILYADDFENDTVGEMAARWTQDTVDSALSKGTFTVVSDNGNKVLQGAATSGDFIMDIGGDVGWTDYTFQVDIKVTSGASFECGVFGRFALGSDKGNYYEAYMDDSGAVQLRVRLNGSTTTLGSKSTSTTGDAALGTVYTFRLDLHGPNISLSVNGVPRVSMVTDTTLTAGGIGLIVNDGTAEFDNVLVTK